MAGRRSDRARARGGGRGGLPAVRVRPPPCVRAQTVRRSHLACEANCRSKVQFVEAQRGVRREHEVMTTMDKARCLEGCERVDHF